MSEIIKRLNELADLLGKECPLRALLTSIQQTETGETQMQINLNTRVYVVLTDEGRAQLDSEPQLDARGFYSCTLWELFKTFNGAIAHHLPTPFEDNVIHIEK